MTTKKITIEVEVPEGVDEGLARLYLERAARKLRALAEMEASPESQPSPEARKLLEEIRRSVAERSR